MTMNIRLRRGQCDDKRPHYEVWIDDGHTGYVAKVGVGMWVATFDIPLSEDSKMLPGQRGSAKSAGEYMASVVDKERKQVTENGLFHARNTR